MTTLPVPLFNFYVWASDSKVTLLTPSSGVTRMAEEGITRHKKVMTYSEHEFNLVLDDLSTQHLVKGSYYELYAGKTSQILYASGYLQQISKTSDDVGSYQLRGLSSMSMLASFDVGDNLYTSYQLGYTNILHRFNGINPYGSGATPNQKGVLTGTGWTARWVDGINVPVATSTTTIGATGTNATFITVGSTTSSTLNNAVSFVRPDGSSDFYRLKAKTSTSVTIDAPGTIFNYPVGTTVKFWGYQLPGLGVPLKAANVSALSCILADAKKFNFLVREADGSMANNGTIEIGPLGDSSGAQIWGGEQLAALQGTNTTYWAHRPNYGSGWQSNYGEIESVEEEEDLTKIVNTCWPFGKGKGDKAALIRVLCGGPPADGSGNPINGWTVWQPYGAGTRKYYLKTSSVTTWQGNQYEFISFQRQDAKYQYGVINRGASPGTGPPPYDVRQASFKDTNVHSAQDLLAEALGTVEYNADPIPSYTFHTRFNQDPATGLPINYNTGTTQTNVFNPKPGQQIDIRFTGEVHNATDISTTHGPTYGQLIDVGPYQYMKYPTIADPTDENGSVDLQKVKKMAKMAEIQDTWTPDGYSAAITMGSATWQSKVWAADLAADMTRTKHERDPSHEFTEKTIDQIHFYLSNDPNATEYPNTAQVGFDAGAYMISDVDDATFFGDHRTVQGLITISDATSWFEIGFGKPYGPTLLSWNAGGDGTGLYAVYRLAMPSSGKQSGFYTTSDGATYTARGRYRVNDLIDPINFQAITNGPGPWTFHFQVKWEGKAYKLQLGGYDTTGIMRRQWVAVWNDTSNALPAFGAIFFHSVGGSGTQTSYLSQLHAHPKHVTHAPQGGITTREMSHGHHTKKRNRLTASQYNNGLGGAGGGGHIYQTR